MKSTTLGSAILVVLLAIPSAVAVAGGGGSNCVFTLDRGSPTLLGGQSGATIFVDDPGRIVRGTSPGGPLTVALPASGLLVPAGANVDGLASGNAGFLAILSGLRQLNLPEARFQFSVARLARDRVTGVVAIPFGLPPLIEHTSEFGTQYIENDQAADVFDNIAGFGLAAAGLGDRTNLVTIPQELLELVGTPPGPPGAIDDLDDFDALGAFGVTELDGADPFPGLPDVRIYFSVDRLTATMSPGTIYVKPAGPAPRLPFATPVQLGLTPDRGNGSDDDVDAIVVLDRNMNLVFDGPDSTGDADVVLFSLSRGSRSLPMNVGGVRIDEGGIFMAIAGEGIVTALPGAYFSLRPRDELDGLVCADPRNPMPFGCLTPTIVRPFESFSLSQEAVQVFPGTTADIFVSLNDHERIPFAGGVIGYDLTVTVENPAVAEIAGATSFNCSPGAPPGCCSCLPGMCPGPVGTVSTCGPVGPLLGPDLCLAEVVVRGLVPGTTRILVTGMFMGATGPIPVREADGIIVVPGAPPSCGTLTNHAAENALLSVAARGGIGFPDDDQAAGLGFVYPAESGVNRLFIGGFTAGTAEDYVLSAEDADDPVRDWVGGCLMLTPAPAAMPWVAQHSEAPFSDGGHPSPRGLSVVQHCYTGSSAPDDDYAILRYEITNQGSAAVNDLRCGLFLDWDLDESGGFDQTRGATDAGRSLMYMWRDTGGDGTYVGAKALSPSPAVQMNFVLNPTYIYPYGYLRDADRFHFLAGDDPAHVVPATPAADDWSAMLGAGPYSLDPGERVECWFAVVGGSSLVDLQANADAAQGQFDGLMTSVPTEPAAPASARLALALGTANPFRERTDILFDLPAASPVRLEIFDVRGRLVNTLADGEPMAAGRHTARWDGTGEGGRALPSGIYFARLAAGGETKTVKLILNR